MASERRSTHAWPHVSTEPWSRSVSFRSSHSNDGSARYPIGIALRAAAAIEAVGGAYFVGGSVASSLQGDPRSTNDIDIVIALAASRVDAFGGTLGTDFELDVDMLRDALVRRS